MYPLKIFADKHNYPTAMLALTEALPLLKDQGYDTLYLESPWGNADIDEVITLTGYSVRSILLFQSTDGIVPEKKTKEQEELIQEMLPDYENYQTLVSSIKIVYDNEKNFLESHQQRIKMLEILKKLGMRLINIDVANPLALNNPGDIGKRNIHMVDSITKNIEKSKKGIVFIGFAHAIDIWEQGSFNLGVLSLVLNRPKIFDVEKCKIYYVSSHKENSEEIKRDILVPLDRCGNRISSRVQIVDVSKGEKFFEVLTKDLKAEDSGQPIFKKIDESEKSLYFISEDRTNQNIHYAASLGGVLKGRAPEKLEYDGIKGFIFEMPVAALSGERRKILGLGRGFLPNLSELEVKCLKETIKTLTIDKVGNPKPGFVLTFLDDSKIPILFHMKNEECISYRSLLVKYDGVIKKLNEISVELRWKMILDKNKKPLARITGYFDNKDGAEKTSNQIKQGGFKDAYIEEDKGCWIIFVSNLDKYLDHKITPQLSSKSSLFPSPVSAQGTIPPHTASASMQNNSKDGKKEEIIEESKHDDDFSFSS